MKSQGMALSSATGEIPGGTTETKVHYYAKTVILGSLGEYNQNFGTCDVRFNCAILFHV